MTTFKEIRPLTGLRGFAAVYVVLYHYLGPLPYSNPLTTFMAHGYLAVDLFFVISGFVMAMNYGHMFETNWSLAAYRKFLGRRIARIYPLYLAATIVGFIEVARHQHFSGHLARIFTLNIAMVQVWGLAESFDSACWSISAEWAAYLIFPILLLPTLYGGVRSRWLSAIVCTMMLLGLCFLPAAFHGHGRSEALLDLVLPNWGIPVFRCIAEFALGLLAFCVARSRFGTKLASNLLLAPLVGVTTIILMAVPQADLFVVLLFPILVISITSEDHVLGRLLSSRPAEFIGTISYSIYLEHTLLHGDAIRKAIISITRNTGLAHPESYATAVLFILTFPVGYLAYRIIERPGRQWLRVIFEGSPRKSSTQLSAGPGKR